VMRLFVALPIWEEVRNNLAAPLSQLRRADPKPRWVPPANLHVTLKFIGEVPPEERPAIEQALAGVSTAAPLDLEFRGIGFFPSDRRPSVLCVGIHASPELPALAARIDRSLVGCGVPRETRVFSPHLTLARLKEASCSPLLRAQMGKFQSDSFGGQTATEFHLIESKLKTTGAEYTTLRSFPFDA